MITRAAATGTTIIPRFVNVVAFLSKLEFLYQFQIKVLFLVPLIVLTHRNIRYLLVILINSCFELSVLTTIVLALLLLLRLNLLGFFYRCYSFAALAQ
jgi:hypothetical protein